MIVIDASLATKLVIDEIDSEMAEQWLAKADPDLVAPDLIAIEVAQAIVRRVNMRDVGHDEGSQTLSDWRALLEKDIELRRTDPDQMEIAAELAMQMGHPVKDCVYLALAMEHGCELATSDAKFAAKARRLYPAVKLLADYGN